jgi:hypothetical protein
MQRLRHVIERTLWWARAIGYVGMKLRRAYLLVVTSNQSPGDDGSYRMRLNYTGYKRPKEAVHSRRDYEFVNLDVERA